MPPRYWDEVVKASAHLINRLPSIVFNGQILITILFKLKLDYNLLKMFGCACSNLTLDNQHKL